MYESLLCRGCNTYKDTSCFHKSNTHARGFNYLCKDCRKVSDAQKYIDNKEKILQQVKEHRRNKRYGVTPQQYFNMRINQDFCCAICGIDEDELNKQLGVDHNHATKVVRELLCVKCNAAIGLLNEDIELIHKVIDYLIKHQGVSDV